MSSSKLDYSQLLKKPSILIKGVFGRGSPKEAEPFRGVIWLLFFSLKMAPPTKRLLGLLQRSRS